MQMFCCRMFETTQLLSGVAGRGLCVCFIVSTSGKITSMFCKIALTFDIQHYQMTGMGTVFCLCTLTSWNKSEPFFKSVLQSVIYMAHESL